MALTGKTIGQLTYLSGVTSETLFPVELNGETFHVAYSAFTNANYNSTTYEELYSLWSGGTLTAGNFYLITDYQTCYDQPNYDNIGNEITTGNYKTGSTEPIVVFATSNGALSPIAFSTTNPKDKITYDISWNTTEVTNSPAKGRITERIDDKNNRTDYDFRAVQFIRYNALYSEVYLPGTVDIDGSGNVVGNGTQFTNDFSVGQYLGIKDGSNPIGSFKYYEILTITDNNNMTVTGTTFYSASNKIYSRGITSNYDSPWQCNIPSLAGSQEYYTFDLDNSTIVNNYLGNNTDYTTFILSNNVFIGNQYNNYFGPNVVGNTFDDDINNNVVGPYFQYNIITNDFDNNQIGSTFQYNTIIDDVNDNIITNRFTYNMIGNNGGGNFDSNIIQANFSSNFLTQSDSFQYNLISENFTNNLVDADFNGNTIQRNFENNTILVNFSNNNISTFFNSVTIDEVANNFAFRNNNFTYEIFNTNLVYSGGTGGNPIFYTDMTTNVVKDANDNIGYVTFLSGGTFVAETITV